MKMTLIDDDNARFFEAAIKERYSNKSENELYAGVIDDNGEAVGAGIFLETSDGLDLDYIAVTEDRRRQGIGSFLLREIKRVAESSGIGSMHAVCITDTAETDSDALFSFLIRNGFRIEKLDAERRVYDLYKFMSLPAFAESPLKRPYMLKSVAELSGRDRDKILSLNVPMVDPQEVVSLQNRYGCILFEKDELRAILVAEPFLGGVRIGSLYCKGDGYIIFPHLFDFAREAVRREGMELNELYIDTVGDRMASFEKHFLEKYGIHPAKSFQVYDAVAELR